MKYLQPYKLFESKFTDESDFSKYNFNCGDCDVYAIALHRVYGYPLYIVNGYFKEDDWDEEAGFTEYDSEPAHIVVKLPNGNYMDSDGEITEEQLKANCAFGNKIEWIKIEPITDKEAEYIYSGEDQEEDIERVVKYIKSKESLSESLDKVPGVNEINEEVINHLFIDLIDKSFKINLHGMSKNNIWTKKVLVSICRIRNGRSDAFKFSEIEECLKNAIHYLTSLYHLTHIKYEVYGQVSEPENEFTTNYKGFESDDEKGLDPFEPIWINAVDDNERFMRELVWIDEIDIVLR